MHVNDLVEQVATFARRTKLRELVRRSPLTESVWVAARAALVGAEPVSPPPPAPAAAPPLEKIHQVVPHRFRKLLSERHGIPDLDGERDPLKRMYLDFALSTVHRALEVRSIVGSRVTIKGRRYLDVGCAYGGFLAAFASAGAVGVTGFDYDEKLLDYARALLADHGVEANVSWASILDDVSARLGRFDLITCNDVLEHVDDTGLALKNLAALLAPDGYMFLEIPNRFAATYVRKDGHFHKFGLTSLPKYLADQRFFREEQRKHDVTYRSIDWYTNRLARLGLSVTIENPVPVDPHAHFARLSGMFDEVAYAARKLPGLDPQTARYAVRAAAQFRDVHGKWRLNPTPELTRRIQLTWSEEFWRLSVRRAPS